MYVPQLIICEKARRWAPALRAALGSEVAQLVETRSLAQCSSALAASPASVVLVEISRPNLEAALMFLQRSSRHFPSACLLAALPVDFAIAEALLREAGAALVFTSTLEVTQISQVVLRHLAIQPPADYELAEFVTARMPWTPPGEKHA